MTYRYVKQPHEDVTGTERRDWLLSLDEQAVPHREAIAALAMHLWAAVMVDHSPRQKWMRERIGNPRPGDYAVELTSCRRSDPQIRLKRFGVLIAARREWMHTDAQWAALLGEGEYSEDEGRPEETVFYLQYGPHAADICRWSDAMAITVPVDMDIFDEGEQAWRAQTCPSLIR